MISSAFLSIFVALVRRQLLARQFKTCKFGFRILKDKMRERERERGDASKLDSLLNLRSPD
jgi:hypothetical protein